MTATLPVPIHRRTPNERRAWLQGWLSCWVHIAGEIDIEGKLLPPVAKTLVHAFREQLEKLNAEEKQ